MARKKNRPNPVLPSAPAPASATALSTAPSPAPAPMQAPLPTLREMPARETCGQTALGVFLRRLFVVFSGLPLAIVLLTIFTATLAVGTVLESKFSAEIASNLLYHTWW